MIGLWSMETPSSPSPTSSLDPSSLDKENHNNWFWMPREFDMAHTKLTVVIQKRHFFRVVKYINFGVPWASTCALLPYLKILWATLTSLTNSLIFTSDLSLIKKSIINLSSKFTDLKLIKRGHHLVRWGKFIVPPIYAKPNFTPSPYTHHMHDMAMILGWSCRWMSHLYETNDRLKHCEIFDNMKSILCMNIWLDMSPWNRIN